MEEDLLKGREHVEVEVDPALFPLDVVHKTVYDLQEKAYFIVSDPGTGKFKVTIVKRGEKDLKEVALEFLTLLSVNSAIRRNELETQRMKEILSASLLLSNARNLQPVPGKAKERGGRGNADKRGEK